MAKLLRLTCLLVSAFIASWPSGNLALECLTCPMPGSPDCDIKDARVQNCSLHIRGSTPRCLYANPPTSPGAFLAALSTAISVVQNFSSPPDECLLESLRSYLAKANSTEHSASIPSKPTFACISSLLCGNFTLADFVLQKLANNCTTSDAALFASVSTIIYGNKQPLTQALCCNWNRCNDPTAVSAMNGTFWQAIKAQQQQQQQQQRGEADSTYKKLSLWPLIGVTLMLTIFR